MTMFTGTVHRIEDAAERVSKLKSQIVREAILSADLYRATTCARSREIDLAIAACALGREARLWTLNLADFEDVPGIQRY